VAERGGVLELATSGSIYGTLRLAACPHVITSPQMGGIGTGGTQTIRRRLTSDAPRLPLKAIPKFGKTVDLSWETLVGALPTRVSLTGEGVLIETAGTTTRVGMREWPMPCGGVRQRFACPKCGTSRNALHWAGEWGCRGRDCLDLDFPVRHEQRYCPAIRRRARLLRKQARVSSRSLRARVIRAQIAQQEAAMLANLKRANRDLTKRMKRHG
jgi:hypothetical protein